MENIWWFFNYLGDFDLLALKKKVKAESKI